MSTGEFSKVLTEELLFQVNRPGQYLGNEWGAYKKDFSQAKVRLCFAFPDLYELGMSNFGQRILYQLVNNNSEFMADRTYAVESDLEAILRKKNIPLWGFETRQPLSNFELIGFSLQYELTYTNILNMLDLAHIPLVSEDRESLFPLLFAGGPSTVNPEPMAKFMDFFIIGDGESVLPAIMELLKGFLNKAHNFDEKEKKKEFLKQLAQNIEGVYVPRLYEPMQDAKSPQPQPIIDNIAKQVKRLVEPLNNNNQPTKSIVPYLSLIHDRQVLEVRRGCDRGCRFCQPGYTFLPVRERSTDDLLKLSTEALTNTGYDEYSLLSLCVSDYTSLHETVRALNRQHQNDHASMSFPSQRADRMNLDVANELKAVRKSGITLAPEAGTERLRAVINKGLNHKQIIDAITSAYTAGWTSIKLYFMIGLPTEEDSDLEGIIDILKEATNKTNVLRKEKNIKQKIDFTCTISNFVPKPFTPFQWYGQISIDETIRRQEYLKTKLKEAKLYNVKLNFTDPEMSLMEVVMSRGDRKIGDLILKAWQKGAIFDAWNDRFKMEIWQEAAHELDLSLELLASTNREVGSEQPWDVINVGLNNWWLVNEWKKALDVKETANCTENTCHACGICTELKTEHVLAEPKEEVLGKNPFVKKLTVTKEDNNHPSIFVPEFTNNSNVSTTSACRFLFEFCKLGELKFISHLDLLHLFARAAKRAKLKVAYTEGFNPKEKISLALSLSLFAEGHAEIGEIELSETISAEQFMLAINSQLPSEIQITRAKEITNKRHSLNELIARARYRAYIPRHISTNFNITSKAIEEKVQEVLASNSLLVTSPIKTSHKKNKVSDTVTKTHDIRPGIFSLTVKNDKDITVEFEIAHGSQMHVKPMDLLKSIGFESIWRIARIELTNKEATPLFECC